MIARVFSYDDDDGAVAVFDLNFFICPLSHIPIPNWKRIQY